MSTVGVRHGTSFAMPLWHGEQTNGERRLIAAMEPERSLVGGAENIAAYVLRRLR